MQNVPKIVLRRLQSPPAEAHPDADLLTAFAEHKLAGSERDHVVEHLARCSDCREVILLALPPQVEVQPVAHREENWFPWPLLRGSALLWAALAVTVIVIASIGTLQYRRQQNSELVSNVPQAKPVIPAPVPTLEASLPAAIPQARTQKVRTQKAGAQKEKLATSQFQTALAENKPTGEAQSETAQVTSQPAAENQLQDQNAQPLQPSTDQFEAVDKAKPASAQSALAPAPSLHTEPSLLKNLATPRWSINTTGTLQRSLDGGKTWLDVNVVADESISPPRSGEKKSAPADPTIFRALSVSSNATEVWAGGSGGALYHTVDGGNRWVRVAPSAAGVVLAGDILSIQFSDQSNGTVATSTAEIWITPDDGQTWRQQP